MPIFDQGYQHWSGRLSGHAWRPLAIARHGVRTSLKGWIIRLVLFGSMVPALLLAGMLCVWGLLEHNRKAVEPYMGFLNFIYPNITADPRHYRLLVWTVAYDYFLKYELQLAMILILMVGPSLISMDLRFNALPLYFSRPLRRIDYFLGKLGVIAAILALVMILPSIVAYVLGIVFSLDLTIIRDTFGLLIGVIFYGLIVALSSGMLVLALSALSRNSRYITLVWMAVWLVTLAAMGVLQGMNESQQRFAYYNELARIQMESRNNRPTSRLSGQQWLEQQRHRQEERLKAQARLDAAIATITKDDWRPLVSYTDNFARLRRKLLGADTQWMTVAMFQPDEDLRAVFIENHVGPQYPWYWSAGVLIGLFGLSACMLHFPIRSLDRLK